MTAGFGSRYEYQVLTSTRTGKLAVYPIVKFVHAVPEDADWITGPSLCTRARLRQGDAPDIDHPEVEFWRAIRHKRLPACPTCWKEYERLTDGAPRWS